MAYNAVSQYEMLSPVDSRSNYSNSPPPLEDDDLHSPGLFLAASNYTNSAGMQEDSVSTRSTYDMLDDRDYQGSPVQEDAQVKELHIIKRRSHGDDDNSQNAVILPQPVGSASPQERTSSMHSASLQSVSIPLRQPTLDASMPGAMAENVDHFENTAERLSMTSDMGFEVQKMNLEQKPSDSRRSSLLASGQSTPINKQLPSNSIVEMNTAARSGGYSPGGFMISPRSSFSNRGRSASKGSRYSSRPEPEQEGRPLDSFANSINTLSPVNSRASSFAEGAEMSTMARALAGTNVTSNPTSPVVEIGEPNSSADDGMERPATSASQTTFEQAHQMFQDFDGVHSHDHISRPRATSDGVVGGIEDSGGLGPNFLQGLTMPGALPHTEVEDGEPQELLGIDARISSARSSARPQSYADPKTGQEMVYYPAPVPAVLNLPQKLSHRPSPLGKERRKSQVLSKVPEGTRESEILLSDSVEKNVDSVAQKGDNTESTKKPVPQQRRVSLGGRILTQDSGPSPRPPIYRPIASFKHPSLDKRIPQRNSMAAKNQSPVATLDKILDASANAPVSAFVDHPFAGENGSEVYGKSRAGKSVAGDDDDEKKLKRRSSFGQWLARASGLEYDPNTITTDLSEIDIKKAKEREKEKERRRSMSGIPDGLKSQAGGRDEDESHEGTPLHPVGIDPGDENGQFHNGVYLGPPNTLLAELQVRKQHAKQRTRPVASMYPNGLHSTLIELDTVAETERRARERRRVTLGWEDSNYQDDDDEDVPLGLLYPDKKVSHPRSRSVGLLERREREDSEPLSHRRHRLRPASAAAPKRPTSSMLDMPLPGEDPKKRESYLANSRPVSGDFASELMSQFGGDLLGDETETKDKGKGRAVDFEGDDNGLVPEEEETLAQRKKRLRAEREAREAEVGPGLAFRSTTPYGVTAQEQRPQLKQRTSMADILGAHPAGGRTSPGPRLVTKRSSSYSLGGGLLGLHDQEAKRRTSALSLDLIRATPKPPGTQRQPNRASSMTMAGMGSNMGMGMMGGAMPYGAPPHFQNLPGMYNANVPQFASPTMGVGFQGNNNFAQMTLIQQQQYMMAANYGNYPQNFGYAGQMPYGGMGMGMMPMAAYNGHMGMGMGGYNQMGGQMNGMGMQQMPLSQGQLEMVERWRQSILQ